MEQKGKLDQQSKLQLQNIATYRAFSMLYRDIKLANVRLYHGAQPDITGEWMAGHFRKDWVFGE